MLHRDATPARLPQRGRRTPPAQEGAQSPHGVMHDITAGKRAFDLAVSLVLVLLLWPVLLGTALLLLLAEGRPILYLSERSGGPGRRFRLWKFRTMPVGADAAGGVSGGDKTRRLSRLHRTLRRTRIDELPQLWNVLRGDMSLVGPRPPDPHYVEMYPELYAAVLRCRPGVTGLATLVFHEHEERLLAACRTPGETDATYRRRCVHRKARLDLIYQRHQSLLLDLGLVARTAARPVRQALLAAPRRPSRPALSLGADPIAPAVPAE